MNIYLRGAWAFVDLGNGYLLCIGRKEEVIGAGDAKISEMIREAVATARYHDMTVKPGEAVH